MSIEDGRAATIQDVARVAGVSRAAVSKVLRDAYGVSPAMRDRVTAAMTELQYRPRLAARAMRGQTYSIGIEIPDFGNQFFTRMLTGATQALAGTPYQVVVAPAQPGAMEGLQAIEALQDRQVDGIIAVSPRVPQGELERIAERTPVVMFGRHDVSAHYDTVAGDDVAGAHAALQHLLDLGHRSIAHLTLDDLDDDGSAAPHERRLHEYREFVLEHALEAPVVVTTAEGQERAYVAVRDALDSGLSSTAIFAAHDELAIGALRAIAEVDAPVSVVGYDDVPIAGHPALGLTTVYQPGIEMGVRAMELIRERLAGRTEPVHEVFAPELRVRTSSFPPAR